MRSVAATAWSPDYLTGVVRRLDSAAAAVNNVIVIVIQLVRSSGRGERGSSSWDDTLGASRVPIEVMGSNLFGMLVASKAGSGV